MALRRERTLTNLEGLKAIECNPLLLETSSWVYSTKKVCFYFSFCFISVTSWHVLSQTLFAVRNHRENLSFAWFRAGREIRNLLFQTPLF